jgi:hypothetical protein
MSLKAVISVLFLSLLGACSDSSPDATQPQTDSPKTDSPNSDSTVAQATKIDDALPEATVIRVKLDQNGNVVSGSESMRLVAKTSLNALVADEFASAKAAPQASNLDELDSTSSAQSWFISRFSQEASPYQQGQTEQSEQDPRQAEQGHTESNQNEQNGYQQSPYYGNTSRHADASQSPQQCGSCPQPRNATVCVPCDNEVEHRQGQSTAEYPVSRRTVYEHRTRNVYPQQYVDVYPVETIRVHPTRTITRIHPLRQQVEYVGNHCVQQTVCGYGAQYYPTVQYGSYHQYFHYQSYNDYRGYRYYRYARPRVFARYGW